MAETADRDPNEGVALKLRCQERLRAKLDAAAKQAGRSLNSEIVHRLEESFADADKAIIDGIKTLLYETEHKDIDETRLALMKTVLRYGPEKVVDPLIDQGKSAQEIFQVLYDLTKEEPVLSLAEKRRLRKQKAE